MEMVSVQSHRHFLCNTENAKQTVDVQSSWNSPSSVASQKNYRKPITSGKQCTLCMKHAFNQIISAAILVFLPVLVWKKNSKLEWP